MSNLIFFVIVIGIFVIRSLNKNAKKEGQAKRRQTQNVSSQRRPVQRQGTTQTQRDAYYYSQQQRATKERLQQKYAQKSYVSQQQKKDILSRAKENVRESEPSAIRQELHAEVCKEYRTASDVTQGMAAHVAKSPECSTYEDSDILKKVNDLIVMGYSGDMTFDRDFIAEGVDMLNHFSI